MFNMFSGGALSRFSLFALNVVPYISASIVVQLMTQILPSWKAMSKEGESGRRKITQYSRIGAVFLAIFQAAGIAIALQSQGAGSGYAGGLRPGPGFVLTAVVSLTAGTMFLMWLGEQITERGIGNGISLIIFAGIVAGLPGAVLNTLQQASKRRHAARSRCSSSSRSCWRSPAFVVFVERGQRRITVNYARRQGGRGLHEPELVPAAEAQHGRRDPADLRVLDHHVPGDGLQLVGQRAARQHVAAEGRRRCRRRAAAHAAAGAA
jgi:preprotein translocase subunit SecY